MRKRHSNYSFSAVPNCYIKRSKFSRTSNLKTSMSMGHLYPIYLDEVIAGDTFKVDAAFVERASNSFIKPQMENYNLDLFFFYVPFRLVSPIAEIFGENKYEPWAITDDPVDMPAVSYNTERNSSRTFYQIGHNSVADYLGLPVGTFDVFPSSGFRISAAPFRAFALIWSEYFRDENVEDPVFLGDLRDDIQAFNTNPWGLDNFTGMLPYVSKYHDYFTSCLPAPQKGPAIDIPLVISGNAPVITGAALHNNIGGAFQFGVTNVTADDVTASQGLYGNQSFGLGLKLLRTSGGVGVGQLIGSRQQVNGDPVDVGPFDASDGSAGTVLSNNMYADLSSVAGVGPSVNDFRYAVQLQKLLERDARGGTRYREILLSHYGVVSADARVQVPEFLGGKSTPLNLQQVAQTSVGVDDYNNVGTLSAYSLTNGTAGFTKSFVEPGYVIGVACIRQRHTYQQGIEKLFTRIKRTDFYDPVFANIGEQPVFLSEIYCGHNIYSDVVFGYQEAWASYRYKTSQITGQMRNVAPNSLSVWHAADYYSSRPYLTSSFIHETDANIERGLFVEPQAQDPFILDFVFHNECIRPMPLYSVPSLVDHN